MNATVDPFQQRGYEPIRIEQDQADVRIEGSWPKTLNGTLYRIGPNPQFPPRGIYNPLQGDGMVHAFRLRQGGVSYRNRWVRTDQWKLEHAAGRSLFATSGNAADHDPSVKGKRTNGVANTNMVWHAGKLLALEEGHAPITIDPLTLETLGVWNFAGKLPRNLTAHPKIDVSTGELFGFANFPKGKFDGECALYRADPKGNLREWTTVQGPHAALMHDFAITADFVILLYGSVTISIDRARAGLPPLAFEPKRSTQIAIVPKTAPDQIRWLESAPGMVWHVMNAFNQGASIYLDLCEQNHPMFASAEGAPPNPIRAGQYLHRWTFAADRDQPPTTERLWQRECEYPRIDDRLVGMPYTRGFVACDGGPGTADIFQRGIAGIDLNTHNISHFYMGAQCAVSEPVFIPGSPAHEDYVVANVFDEGQGLSHLALFAADAIAAGPIARAHLDQRVPMGFHGLWVSD